MDCSYQLPREHRGLREELGITDVTLGPELAIRTKEHSVGGKPTRQVERYFVTVVAPDTVDPALATQPDAIRAWHWWTITDIRRTSKTIYPVGLRAQPVAAGAGRVRTGVASEPDPGGRHRTL